MSAWHTIITVTPEPQFRHYSVTATPSCSYDLIIASQFNIGWTFVNVSWAAASGQHKAAQVIGAWFTFLWNAAAARTALGWSLLRFRVFCSLKSIFHVLYMFHFSFSQCRLKVPAIHWSEFIIVGAGQSPSHSPSSFPYLYVCICFIYKVFSFWCGDDKSW